LTSTRRAAVRLAAAIICGLFAGTTAAQQAPAADAVARDGSGTEPGTEPGDGFAVGPARLQPSLGLTFGYDDNLALTSAERSSSALWMLSPALRLQGGSERNRLRAGVDAEVGRHASSPVDDYTDYGFNAAWIYSPLLRHLLAMQVDAKFGHDSRGTAAREGDLGLDQDEVDRFRRNDLSARYRFGAPGARGRLELDARAGDVRYRNNRELTAFRDRSDDGIGGAFYWRVASRTSALVRLEREQFDYDLATLDSTESHVFVGAEIDATARTSGALLVGRASKRFDDPARPDFSGASWRANVEYKPRSYSSFSVSTGGATDETNGFGDFILRRDVTVGWNHNWSGRLRTTLDGGLAKEEQRPTERTDQVRYVGLAADYAFRRWLRGGASWRLYNRDSDVATFDYRRNVLLFSLEANL